MGLGDAQVVDSVGLSSDGSAANMALIDEWDWSAPEQHLAALRSKLEAYLNFVADGQLVAAYPKAAGLRVNVVVFTRYPLPQAGHDLLTEAHNAGVPWSVSVEERHVAEFGEPF